MPCITTFFGHKLDAGARVAAFYTILFSFLMAARGFWYLKQINDWDAAFEHNKKLYSFSLGKVYKDYEYEKHKAIFPIAISFICFGILFFIVSIFLFHSGFKKSNRYVWPWIVIVGVGIGYFLVQLVYYGFIVDSLFPEAEAIIGLLLIFVMVYFYVVVCSYKQWVAATETSVPSVTQEYPIEPSIALQPVQSEPTNDTNDTTVADTDEKDKPPDYSNFALSSANFHNQHSANYLPPYESPLNEPPPQYSDISKC